MPVPRARAPGEEELDDETIERRRALEEVSLVNVSVIGGMY